MAQVPVALQLYTVRDETAKDFAGTVRKVAQMGYAGVEFAGTGGLSAEAMADLLAETGLAVAGAHIGLPQFEYALVAGKAMLDQKMDDVIAYFQALGAKYVGVPALAREMRNPAGFHEAAAAMNRIGAEVKSAGMTLYYHNHDFEFQVIDGQRGWDILMAELDPSLVAFEIDCYWVTYAGLDPAALIQAHAGRFPLIHLKDMTGTGDSRTFAEVGEGHIDWQPVFAASEAQGATWYVVEQDRCARPSLVSAALSLAHLRNWGKA